MRIFPKSAALLIWGPLVHEKLPLQPVRPIVAIITFHIFSAKFMAFNWDTQGDGDDDGDEDGDDDSDQDDDNP